MSGCGPWVRPRDGAAGRQTWARRSAANAVRSPAQVAPSGCSATTIRSGSLAGCSAGPSGRRACVATGRARGGPRTEGCGVAIGSVCAPRSPCSGAQAGCGRCPLRAPKVAVGGLSALPARPFCHGVHHQGRPATTSAPVPTVWRDRRFRCRRQATPGAPPHDAQHSPERLPRRRALATTRPKCSPRSVRPDACPHGPPRCRTRPCPQLLSRQRIAAIGPSARPWMNCWT